MELLIPPADRVAERGITLVETLAAVLILSLVAISVLSMFSQGMALNISGADYTMLTNEARHKAEELMALAYADLALAPDMDHSVVVTQPYDFTVTWRVIEHRIVQGNEDPATILAASPNASTAPGTGNIKVIRVTVVSGAVAGVGQQRNVTVQTIKLAEAA